MSENYEGNLCIDMLRERSDPRRQKAMEWGLKHIDQIQWVGWRKCSVCSEPGHNKRTCIRQKEIEFCKAIQPNKSSS